MTRTELQAALAAHRFGLGEPSLNSIGGDAPGWLQAQIGPAQPQRGQDLVGGVEGLKRFTEFVRSRRQIRSAAGQPINNGESMGTPAEMGAPDSSIEREFAQHFRQLVQNDLRARLATAATSTAPFNERLAWFWANHFTVSMAKPSTRGVAGAFEREAIRPHIGGDFQALLQAAVTHVGMLRYLDNDQSAGPNSQIVRRLARRSRNGDMPGPRVTGLNENLAREVLELHTLGVNGGYSQADVTEFARVLTGWRVPLRELLQGDSSVTGARFDPTWHEPGPKTVLGKRYAEGPEALRQVLHDLALHPSTAKFVATKLARHFVADEPPAELVTQLEASFRKTGGDLPALYRTLVQSPLAWAPQQAKLKTPEEFVVSTARVLKLGEQAFGRNPDGAINQLGQRVMGAPSPAGWPDRAEEWLGPDAVWKRVEWATRVANGTGRHLDARALAAASLGPLLTESTARQIERAADGPQALALLLLAPEFQRR
jgi:uncharacterized protein (DUF1800 family)